MSMKCAISSSTPMLSNATDKMDDVDMAGSGFKQVDTDNTVQQHSRIERQFYPRSRVDVASNHFFLVQEGFPAERSKVKLPGCRVVANAQVGGIDPGRGYPKRSRGLTRIVGTGNDDFFVADEVLCFATRECFIGQDSFQTR